ncbi:MAG: pyridoxal phosphate-dependent aminotransferase, partial [Candidatus Acidiferrum sp.]
IDFHSLEQAITSRTRGVIVVHPNNPTGNFCKSEEMRKLNEICAAHKVAIVADEVFLDFSQSEKQPSTFAANSKALTFTMSGLSKICGLPQMKAAWLIVGGPEPRKSEALARLEVIADTYLSMNAPIQLAMPQLLGQRQAFQKQLLARVKMNLAELDRQLAGQKFSSRLEVEGGWNTVIRVPATRSDEDLALELLATGGVIVHPGRYYDFPHEGYLAISVITPSASFADGINLVLSVARP